MAGPTLITGACGVIGQVLTNGFSRTRRARCVDLPDVDLRDPGAARQAVVGCESVVHLASNTRQENYRSRTLDAGNIQMTFNVLNAALGAGVHRFIFASSVHAHTFAPSAPPLVQLPGGVAGAEGERAAVPDSPYGASKLCGEALCRWAASGLITVVIRFGGVNAEDIPPEEDAFERAVWLRHRDCLSVVEASLDSEVPEGFAALTAVSDNACRIHNFANSLDWTPVDGASARQGS